MRELPIVQFSLHRERVLRTRRAQVTEGCIYQVQGIRLARIGDGEPWKGSKQSSDMIHFVFQCIW